MKVSVVKKFKDDAGWDGNSSVKDCDVIVALGGDGTVIKAFNEMMRYDRDVPILGFNTGSLGFLTEIKPQDDRILQVIETLVNNESFHSRRSVLEITSSSGSVRRGLNEITFHPKHLGRLLSMNVTVNDNNHFDNVCLKGDGLIISTSTGSTAYNLSAGGPILSPTLDALIMTPLNPFSLSTRSLALPPDATLHVSSKDDYIVYVDGNMVDDIPGGYSVTTSKQKYVIIKSSSFVESIQTKLGWNKSIK